MVPEKYKSRAEMRQIVERLKAAGSTVVFANGCFDLLHAGHIRCLEAARALGDALVVGLNSDSSVRSLKGEGRPILDQEERAEILAALGCVDYLVVFDDPTVDELLRDLKPHIHAKGSDYSEESVPERQTVLGYGGGIAIVGGPKAFSTRSYLEQVRQLEDESSEGSFRQS